ncbi:WD repeat-containing protein 70 [Chytridiales sp. JEL 0842]|nr:WD repeat-containing protein 70 [Chytridiales sp. JEL 0842]
MFEEANAIFSPNDKYVVTGTSARKGHGAGKICFYNKHDLSPAHEVPLSEGSVVKVMWHGRINQILASTSEGSVNVYYDMKVSSGGAKLCADKKAKGRQVDDIDYSQLNEKEMVILTPHALPMFKDPEPFAKGKRKLGLTKNDLPGARKPDKGAKGGAGGSLDVVVKDRTREEDPREAILKHAAEADSKPFWIAPAYKQNQPKPVLAPQVFEDEDEAERAAKKQRPK